MTVHTYTYISILLNIEISVRLLCSADMDGVQNEE